MRAVFSFFLVLMVICVCGLPSVSAQQARSHEALSLKQLLSLANERYPVLRAKHSTVTARLNNITAAERTALPSLDLSLQANAASHNNITGMFFSQGILPISGPPSSGNSFIPAWGSAASALFTWQPITFGQREADIALAQAEWTEGTADEAHERLQHTKTVLETYLDLTLARELQSVARMNLDRATALATRARILSEQGLQPSADSATAAADRSRAVIDVLTTQELESRLLVHLMELIASEQPPTIATDSLLLRTVPRLAESQQPLDTAQNPLLQLSAARVQSSKARMDAANSATNPRLTLWTTAAARGSGIAADGTLTEGLGGLEPSRFNYGVGLHISWSPLLYLQNAPKVAREEALMRASEEQLSFAKRNVQAQMLRADTRLRTAFLIAEEVPKQVRAAEIAFTSRQTKYNAGLLPYTDIAQARYLLAEAETAAHMRIAEAWKALVNAAALRGDFREVLQQLHGQ
jgi:outer membrane protein TolC